MKYVTGLAVAVVAIVVLLGGCMFFSQYTGMVAMREVVKQDWAELDAQLRSRGELIPGLISAVRDRAPDAEDVFAGVEAARGKLDGAATPPARAEAEEALTAALDRLFVVAGRCPGLNADENFIRLQDELDDAEKGIEVSRRKYNDNVEIYNMCIGDFPGSLVAGRIGFIPREPFEPPQAPAGVHGEAVPDEAETEKPRETTGN